MIHLSNVCSASPINNNIFSDGHGGNFDDLSLINMEHHNIHPFVLKSVDSMNEQKNGNDPNEKLKYLYDEVNYDWMLKYWTTKILPHHVSSILVEAWDVFKVSSKNS